MAGSWSNTYQSSLTIPTGATTGARIEIDGITGEIRVYDATGLRTILIGGSEGLINDTDSGTGLQVQFNDGQVQFPVSRAVVTDDTGNNDLVLESGVPFPAGTNRRALLRLHQGTTAGTTGSANATRATLLPESGGLATDLYLAGALLRSDTSGTAATWQTPSYNSGWAGGDVAGTFRPLQYRLDAQDNLYVSGAMHTTSATPSTFAFTLSAAWRPTTNQRAAAVFLTGGVASVSYFQVGSNGSTGAFPLPTAANVDVFVSAIFPMGNIA